MNNLFTPFRQMPPVVKNLLLINVIVWLFMLIVPAADRILTKYLALYYFTSPGFYPWQLFTYMFLHSGITHLFFNMFALVVFGSVVERMMGSQRFLLFYITCGIGAALIQLGVFAAMIANYSAGLDAEQYRMIIDRGWQIAQQGYAFTDPTAAAISSYANTPMVGASGAIYGIIIGFAMLLPNAPLYIWPLPIPIKAKWIVLGYAVIELVAGFGFTADGVAHFAHLGGMLFGALLILYWKRKGVFNNHWFF